MASTVEPQWSRSGEHDVHALRSNTFLGEANSSVKTRIQSNTRVGQRSRRATGGFATICELCLKACARAAASDVS